MRIPKTSRKRPPEYAALFFMGLIVALIGIFFSNYWMFLLGLLVVALGIFHRRQWRLPAKKGYPRGHWMAVGITIGLIVGMPMGFIYGLLLKSGYLAIGLAMGSGLGVGFGSLLGAFLETKYWKSGKRLTGKEKSHRIILTVITALVFLRFLAIYMLFYL
jgi:hypothetical protein